MPGLLDANLCKNKQTNNNITMLLTYTMCCFCLFLHKLTSNKPGIYWAVTRAFTCSTALLVQTLTKKTQAVLEDKSEHYNI